MKKSIRTALSGVVIGIANVIPGVSGGTMMVVLNVFDDLIRSISGIKKHPGRSIRFLAPLLLGVAIGVFAFARLMEFLLNEYPIPTNFFFIGVLIGSIPFLYHRSTIESFKPKNLIPLAITLTVMLIMFFFDPASAGASWANSSSALYYVTLFFCGVLAAAAMVIPGVSGSFLMVLLGMYDSIIEAVSELRLDVLIIFGIGAVIGIVLVSKVMEHLLTKHPQATYFGILGLVAGSVPSIWPGFTMDITGIIAIAAMIVGFLASYLFSKEKKAEPDAGNASQG